MAYLLVDDEELILEGMEWTLRAVVGDSTVIYKADDAFAALEQMKLHSDIDIVFSDIDMPEMNGLKLAEKIHEINPDADIIFATGYAHYSLDAWKTEAKAFVLKPVSEEDMKITLDRILRNREARGGGQEEKKSIEAKCFGNFEIFFEGQPIHFARKKSKEMIAYLIDRKGAMITTGEIRSALWDEEDDNEEKKGYIRVLANDIRKSLEELGVTGFLINDMDCYGINKNMITCDYLEFMEGVEKAKLRFSGEYMQQYSWSENTLGILLDKMM